MNSTEKLFLLDAYALIYRAYYALIKNPRVNSKGFNTSAVFGFVNTLEEVLKKEQPTHIGVAFDPAGPTFRHEAYEQYKAQREETPEVIRLSVPVIKDIIRAYRIPILEVAGYEADDVIGTLATEAGRRGITTYMMTPDKDYGQLVGGCVYMYRPKHTGGFEKMGTEEVKAKFAISDTRQVIDMLGLMGDASDNIPGCPGVGEKTAQKLIAQFGSIENLLANTDQLKGALKTKVESNREQIGFSKFLATIKTDVPIALDMDALVREEPDADALRRIFDELEFRSLIDRVLGKPTSTPLSGTASAGPLFAQAEETPRTAPTQGDLFAIFPGEGTDNGKDSNLDTLETIQVDYQLVENEAEIRQLVQKLLTSEILSIDTETTSTEPMEAELVGASFSDAENRAWYVPIPADRNQALATVNLLRPLYENEHSLKIGQNIKYDMIVLKNYGIHVAGPLFDTMLAHYVIQPELRHNMDYLAEIYLHYRTIHIDQLIGTKGKGQKSMRDLPPAEVYRYACEDADVTLKLKNVLAEEMEKQHCAQLFYDIEMPLVPVLVNMETNGVRIDTEALQQTSREFGTRLKEIEEDIYRLAGETFNIASPKQVGEVLFDHLKIADKPKKTKTGQYVTSEEVLESLRTKHPVVGRILEHRGLKKLLGTYVDALPQLINPQTGRIHTSFNQAVTATGRLSSSNPNLQNIPVRDDDGKEIRKAFIPDDGCEFFSADYSQIELRIMAHLSGDPHMIEAFRSGNDIHAATAAKIYKINIDEVTPDMRRKAKTANFGIIYGISTFGLAERMGVSRQEAKELIDGYFATYPQVKAYMDRSIEVARSQGYVETIFHRKRFLPDINSRNATVRGYAERNAINAPIQGSAADIIKVAMARIYRRFTDEGLRSKMILQVHDELNFSVLPEEKERVQQIVLEEMEKACPMQVPLKADCGWGKNWLEAH
ncbi:MAG TPA: DNA polymerase I [Candidatus Bacteroides avicola]|uniref:DNA polymerase I n=1 Tax=Candidatus Bacteroides avicola TaxID=2838468 RepID=A0A9D2KX18_9BACE|nr:DNA polymerase I [Candidatus Bacteroides avicola]